MSLANAINSFISGYQSLNSSSIFNSISFVDTSNQTSITNQDGVSGSSVISLTSTIYVNISFNSGTDTLSIYSTGTYSPTITSTSVQPTVGYSVQVGRYTRIGNRLFGSLTIKLNSYTAGTGSALFILPFTALNSLNTQNCYVNYENCINAALATSTSGIITANTNRITFNQVRSGTSAFIMISTDIAANSNFYSSFIYGV